jgi:uncharacterized repeat protein (TIGR01451 family)
MGAAFLCLVAAPAARAATVPVSAPSGSPSPCSTPPCNGPSARVILTQAADKTVAAVGDTVTYTITVANTGSAPAPAVTVDDVLGGDAGFLVEDGTAATADTFVGSPTTIVTRVATGHYRWTYATVSPGDSDVVRFSVVIAIPTAVATPAPAVISLTSTASSAGVTAVTVTTTAALPAGSAGGIVKGNTTAVPSTGSGPSVAAATFLLLGGLGLILAGTLTRRRDQPAG